MTAMRIPARDMHDGDVWLRNYSRLHVTQVDVEGNNVAVFTREVGAPLHEPADRLEVVDR